jgi:hypothetical protein
MTPNTLYLTKVHYIEEKRRILAVFSNCKEKRSKSFSFFPSFFLGKRIPLKELGSILSNYNPQKFRLREKPRAFQITASTFTDLKCLANLCLEAFGQRPLLVEPERQFLIERGWSYFDPFQFFQEKPVKSNNEAFPETRIDSLPEPLPATIQQLLTQNRQNALDFMRGIALSKVLKLPAESLPQNSLLEMETLFENLFFKNGLAAPAESQGSLAKSPGKRLHCPDAIEMDFSELWPLLLTVPFYNLGFDSIDCNCCTPKSAFESNILPHSTARARFLSEGFYFESMVPGYARRFHATNPLGENRMRVMREFYLNYIPVGPFHRGQEAELLLCDALDLCGKGNAGLLDTAQLHWFCLKNESFLSAELRRLNSRIVSLSSQLAAEERAAFRQHNLRAERVLSGNLDFLFKKALHKTMKQMYCAVPMHLLDSKSRFFLKPLAESIEAVQALTLRRFGEVLKEHNGAILAVENAKALIRTEKPLSLAKEFSEREKIPLLISPLRKHPAKSQ